MNLRVLPLVLAAGLLIAVAIAWRVVRAREATLPPRITVDELVRDLSRTLDPAAVVSQTADDPARAGELSPGDRLRGQGVRPALIAPPPSRLRFRLDVPENGVLTFAVGVQGDGKRDRQRSAVRFAIVVNDDELWSRTVNPATSRRQRRWFDERLDLARFAGRSIDLELRTDAESPGRPLSGLAGWNGVRLVQQALHPRQRADAARPNVLVLLVDTLRADHLGVYGATPSPSLHLDRLAATGLVFEQAVAQAPWTLPSVATLFTGLHPRSHGAIGMMDDAPTTAEQSFLPDAVETIAERAARAGITTFGVSTNPVVSRGTNLAQGFERFEEFPWSDKRRNWTGAGAVNRVFADWLARNRGWRFFAYLHYMEPHDPYTPPAAWRPTPPSGIPKDLARGWVVEVARNLRKRKDTTLPPEQVDYLRALYNAEIRAWDEELPRLLEVLDRMGVRDSTVVIVTADHGEEFMEHGQLRHRMHLYDESIHVPLLVIGPRVPAGRRSEQAQGIDLHPTLAALLGLPATETLPGRNLLEPVPARTAILEAVGGLLRDGRRADLLAARTPTWKRIDAPALGLTEAYDLVRDPGEQTSLPPEVGGGPALGWALDSFARSAAAPPAREGYDPALREKLRALGYTD